VAVAVWGSFLVGFEIEMCKSEQDQEVPFFQDKESETALQRLQ
jgi:hypothetical protein